MGVTLSQKYGVNPSVTRCIACGKDYGVALFGTAWKDPKTGETTEAPRYVYQGLCDDCRKVVNQGGLIIIEVRDGETGKNPYRTGRMTGITKEAKERLFKDMQSNICYMEQTAFSQMFNGQI